MNESEPLEVGSPTRYSVLDGDDAEARVLSAAGFSIAVYSRRCPDKTSANEDAAAVISLGAGAVLLVVADGVGGGRAGDQAARIVIEELIARGSDAESEVESDEAIRGLVLSALDRANEAILQLGVGAAATVTCVSIRDGIIRSYQAGDTVGLLVGQRGKLKHQTTSHSPVGYLVESGALHEDDAIDHHDRHLVSNTVGSLDMSIEMSRGFAMSRRDTVLLASDGLTDNLRLEEIVDRVRAGSLPDGARQLSSVALGRMSNPSAGEPSKPDDLTFVLCRQT